MNLPRWKALCVQWPDLPLKKFPFSCGINTNWVNVPEHIVCLAHFDWVCPERKPPFFNLKCVACGRALFVVLRATLYHTWALNVTTKKEKYIKSFVPRASSMRVACTPCTMHAASLWQQCEQILNIPPRLILALDGLFQFKCRWNSDAEIQSSGVQFESVTVS